MHIPLKKYAQTPVTTPGNNNSSPNPTTPGSNTTTPPTTTTNQNPGTNPQPTTPPQPVVHDDPQKIQQLLQQKLLDFDCD